MNETVRWQRPASGHAARGMFPVVGVGCTVFGAVAYLVGLGAAICATLLVVAVGLGVGLLFTLSTRQPS